MKELCKKRNWLIIFLLSLFLPFNTTTVNANEDTEATATTEIKTVEEIIEENQLYNFSSEDERDQAIYDYNLNYVQDVNTIRPFSIQLFSTNASAYGIPPELPVTYTYRFPAGYSTGFGPQVNDYTQHSYLPKAKTSGTYNPTTTLMLWCIEPVDLFSGGANTGYQRVNQTTQKYFEASVIAYWGYESQKGSGNQTANLKRAFMTEKYIQEIITGVRTINISGSVSQSEYNTFKSTMNEEIRKYNTLPSIRNSTTTLGTSAATLTDNNNSISRYVVESNTANVGVSISGNKLTLTPNSNTKNGTVTLKYYVPSSFQRQPARLVHSNARQQELLDAGIWDPKKITLNIQATGDLEIVKQSSDSSVLSNSNYTLQGAEFLVTGPNSFRRTVTTGSNGKVTLTSIPSGTYTVKETKAPTGFTLNSTDQSTTIAGNKKTVTIRNTPIRPVVTVRHIDKDTNAVLATSTHTHYYNDSYSYSPRGDLKYQNKYKYYALDTTKTGRVTSNITLNFYYTKPSVEVGFQKIEITTAPSDKGLPVKLTFNTHQIKSDWLNKQVTISIYDKTTNTRVVSKNATINELRSGLNLTIPSTYLSKNLKRNYEARIEYPNGNLYPNTSASWNSRTFSGWQSYFDTVPVGGTSALQVGDHITFSGTIRPEKYTGGIMAHITLSNGTYKQYHSSQMGAGKEGKVSGGVTIPSGATSVRLALRHMASDTPSQKFNFKELKLEHGSYATAYKADSATEVLVTDNQARINTDGYTSSELTIEENAIDGDTLEYQGVIKTERVVNQNMQVYYETIELPLTELKEIKSGYGFELNQQFTYQNDLNQTEVTDQFEVLMDSPVVDGNMYLERDDKVVISLNNESTVANKVRNMTFEFPQVFVQSKTGTILTPSQASTVSARDGGNKVYIPIWLDELGSYDYTFQNKEPIGINKVNVAIHDQLDVIAYMYAHIGSKTFEKDEILIEPANLKNPFPNGLPEGWTQSDVEWLQQNN